MIEMAARLDELEDMLEQDGRDPRGPNPNLLALHFQLNQLEAFKNTTMYQAKQSSGDVKNTLDDYFRRLNRLLAAFDTHISTLAKNILPLVEGGHPDVVVKLLKIAELEGREDEKVAVVPSFLFFNAYQSAQATAIRLVKKAAKMDAASKFRSIQANARVLKFYRPKIVKGIQEGIRETFEKQMEASGGDPMAFIETLDQWIFLDLEWAKKEVVRCFPPDYDIYTFYIKRYHKELDESFKKIRQSLPPASVLLALHAWVKSYKKKMKELEIPEELLEPPLMGGKEQGLIDDYSKLIVQKLDEWTTNLMKTELQDFESRSEPPQMDSDGLYGMQGAVLLWKLINEQVDAATESGQGAVLARIVSESNRVIKGIHVQWSNLMEAEYKKTVDGKPEEVTPGLTEYIVALANDQVKCADYAEDLSARVEPLVAEKYKVVIADQLNETMDGYLDVAKKCTQTLVDLIFHVLRPATKQLFASKWYDGIMSQIVVTLRDYMDDYQATLNPSLFELLVEDLLETFLVTYLTAIAKASKLRMSAARSRIVEDVSESFKFFSTLKPAKELEAYFEVIELVLGILTASRSTVFISFYQFAKKHGPNLPFVEAVLRARDDLDRSAVNEVMETIKRKVKEDDIGDRKYFTSITTPLSAPG